MRRYLLLLLAGLLLTAPPTNAQTNLTPIDPTDYTWQEVYRGLDNPLFLTHAGDDTGLLYIMEQTGFILILDDGELLPEPFLDITALLTQDVYQGSYSERGLLGLAFDPDFATNRHFFIYHTNLNGDTVLARYTAADERRADPASRVELLTIPQPFADHNGGNLTFGPDGYLYVGVGDGGNPAVPNYNSQDLSALLGKILRLDVSTVPYSIPPDNPFADTPDVAPEIWAFGVRNPWRFSFDPATGDLYLGDVGQTRYEEVNFEPSDDPGGRNYGWSAFEATHRYLEDIDLAEDDVTMPVFEYDHVTGCSVTGGYVYRGADLPELDGVYIFGDYCAGQTWMMARDSAGAWQIEPFIQTSYIISSFGVDATGELYLVDYKGAIYRLTRAEQPSS